MERENFRDWYNRMKPDAIIADAQPYLDEMRELLPAKDRARVRLACTSLPDTSRRFCGIEEDPREIGAAAIEQLDWLYQHGERGIPARPRVTLVAGRYVPAP